MELPFCRAEKAATPEEVIAPVEDEAPPVVDGAPAVDAVEPEPETPKEPEKVWTDPSGSHRRPCTRQTGNRRNLLVRSIECEHGEY